MSRNQVPATFNLPNDFFFFFLFFLGPHLHHMDVPRLGVDSELLLPVYTTTTGMPDLSHIFNLHHSTWQH